ncbi:Protein SMG8 [Orchesella cincta]|uniref:Nonsense-mediated mRNA decay factor SMG8 n=1 Tax=Orchesella cincta TaxID=48709 RepID=A0A1D2NE11_ORCCI|nr:Protein SMG8 [Orchesella cincta]
MISPDHARSQTIVVVSIFGSTVYEAVQGTRFKRAFQLALDGFGTAALYNGASGGGKEKSSGDECELQEKGDDDGGVCDEAEGEQKGKPREEKISETKKDNKGSKNRNGSHLTPEDMKTGGILEGFYNEDESVLFLHIEGFAFDAASCVEACQELRSSMQESGFLSLWSSFNTKYCRWLLLLFSLSHIMIMSESGSSFDTSYLSLFRALDIVRQDVLSCVSKMLSTIEGLPKQWIDHGRICSPRLIFLFEVESENPKKVQTIASLSPCHVKQRKDSLQNEIYQIFRKCRIITNISANSLFAVPASDDFVYVFDKSAQNSYSVSQSLAYTYIDLISTTCKKHAQKISTTPSRTSSNTALPVKMSFRTEHDTLTYADSVNTFRNFLIEHISLALDRGFDDDYRRVSGNKHFFVRPTLGQWEAAFAKLHRHLIVEPTSRRVAEAYAHMQKYINIDSEYLEMQCSELFPKVYAAYQRGLPEFFTAQQHQAKLTYAVNVFLNISRGPGVLPWLTKLASKCEKYWKNGRQQCETLSLLGHVCVNPMHRVTRKEHLEIIPLPEMDNDLSEKPHSSASRIVSYCNCGKKQGSREEPFTIRDANFEFYRKLAKDCCDKFEKYHFAVFTPPEESIGELSLQEMLVILKRKSENIVASAAQDENKSANGFSFASQELLAEVFEAELRQENELDDESEDSSSSSDDEGADENNDSAQLQTDNNEKENTSSKPGHGLEELPPALTNSVDADKFAVERPKLLKHNSSTTEYLPGMLHSKSPVGLLTLYPSWSLVCLGPSSIYSHAHGVHQPGFLNGTNSLLPWDVKVKAEKGVTYAPPPRLMKGRRHHQRPKLVAISSNDSAPTDEFTVKVFFGFEYECRKGHRFFCDSDKVLYTLNNSAVTLKTVAAKVIGSEMLLYINCPCKESRDGKPVIAQLIRLHVVTPKAPVFVTVNPKVQPGPVGTCPIFQTGEDPVKLPPSTYWILRLPFSYVGEVVYVPPSDLTRYNGRALKGILSVVSMNPSETEDWERQNQNR